MGQMTVVSILNDAWPTIKENPEKFIENIEKGMMDYYDSKDVHSYPVGNHANPMEVHTSFHSNMTQVLTVGGNHMENLKDMKPSKRDDFYLSYKLSLAQKAQEAVDAAKSNVVDALSAMIADNMISSGKKVDEVLAIAKSYKTYQLMSEKEQAEVIWKIGCKLAKK